MMGWLHKINQTQRIWSARFGHYWIMRAVQGHSAHFTAHLEIIVDWSKYLEGTAQSHFKEVATLKFEFCSFAQFAHLLPFLSIYLRPFVAGVKLFVFSSPRNIELRDRFLFSSGSIFFPSFFSIWKTEVSIKTEGFGGGQAIVAHLERITYIPSIYIVLRDWYEVFSSTTEREAPIWHFGYHDFWGFFFKNRVIF